MSFGYLGDTSTKIKQVKKNDGILSIDDVLQLESVGHIGESLQFIANQTHSSDVSTIDFTSIKESEFDTHVLHIKNFGFETSIGRIGIQLYESGTLETAGVYKYEVQYIESTGGNGVQTQTAYEYMQIEFQLSTAGTLNAVVYLHNLGNSAKYSFITFKETMQGASYLSTRYGGGCMPQASTVDGLRIMRSGSNDFTSFDIDLYGVKKVWVL
mgnify:CR=1 FL=1